MMMRKTTCIGLSIAAAMLIGSPLALGAPVIFENIGASDVISAGGGRIIRGSDDPPSIANAMAFTPSADAILGSVQLALNGNGSQVGAIDVSLYSGAGSGPDTLIELLGTVGPSDVPVSGSGPFDVFSIQLSSSLNPLLQNGQEYFIAAEPASADINNYAWFILENTQGVWSKFGDNPWTFENGSFDWQPAFRVLAVPKPSTLILAGLAMLGLLAYGQRSGFCRLSDFYLYRTVFYCKTSFSLCRT